MSTFTKAVMIIILVTIYLCNSTRSTTLHEKQEQGILPGGVKEGEIFHRTLPSPIFFHPDHQVQLCGTRLTDTVKMLCRGPLAIHRQSKRNSPAVNHDNAIFKRSIIEECCKKPCTYSSLLKFCVREDQQPTTTTTTTTPAPVIPKPTPTRSGLPMEILRALYKLLMKARMHSQPTTEEKPVSDRDESENQNESNPESLEDVDSTDESKSEEQQQPIPFEAVYNENDDIPSVFFA